MNLQNKSIVLNVVLAIVVVVLGVRLVSGVEDSVESQTQEQVVLDNIATRTSIRDYGARPVEKEKVEKMLRAAMAAPTAMNKQPWHFVVVDQRSVLDSLAGANPYAKMLLKAPLAIVVCGDMDKTIEGGGRDFWIQDASAATENLLLAAHAMGSVPYGRVPILPRIAARRLAQRSRCPIISFRLTWWLSAIRRSIRSRRINSRRRT